MPTMHHLLRRGFTLIELLMALAMGTVIILIATAGLRAASQTMTATNRLSYQNNLLREGFIAACHEVDFWVRVDDPRANDQQPLRQPAKTSRGTQGFGPFTPFATSWPDRSLKLSYANKPERELGWNPSPMAWAAFDPRTWCRINGAERVSNSDGGSSDLRFGDYSLFEHIDPENEKLTQTRSNYTNSRPPLIAEPRFCRSWYGNQLKGSIDAMGLYGFCEYLPSSIFWGYHGDPPYDAQQDHRFVSKGLMPECMFRPNGWLCVGDGDQRFMRGRYRATRCASIPLANPDPKKIALMPTLNSNVTSSGYSYSADPHRVWWLVGEDIDKLAGDSANRVELVNKYLECTEFAENLMTIRPSEWPDMTINVHRYVKNSRMVQLCILEIFDPNNGARTSLPFSAFGTTMRGARQQRTVSLANGGWATYDNQSPKSIKLGPTLDWQYPRTISW